VRSREPTRECNNGEHNVGFEDEHNVGNPSSYMFYCNSMYMVRRTVSTMWGA
jgi:hypothetical protein